LTLESARIFQRPPPCAQFIRDAERSAHALIDRLTDLVRQIHALDTHHHLNAEFSPGRYRREISMILAGRWKPSYVLAEFIAQLLLMTCSSRRRVTSVRPP
jgi:hypothetical protein